MGCKGSRCDSRAKLRSDLQNTSRPSNWRSTSTLVKATSWAEIHLSNTDSTSRTKVHLCSAEQPLARRSQHLHFALSATRLHQLAFRGLRTSTSQVASLNQRSISRSEIDLASTDRQLPTGDQTSHLLHDNKDNKKTARVSRPCLFDGII